MKKTMTAVIVLALFTAFAVPRRAPAQSPAQSESVKLRATEVFVDAVVFDKRNHLIIDLTRDDFEVFEDGAQQEITSFRVFHGGVTKPTTTPARSEQAGNPQSIGSEETPAAPREPGNLLIVLLDYSTTQFEHQKLVREASIKYVEQKLQPNDLMAVFSLGASLRPLTDFTNDKAKLMAALQKTDPTGSGLAADRATLSATIATGQSDQVQSAASSVPSATPSGPGAAAQGAALGNQLAGMQAALMAQQIAEMDYIMRSAMDQRQSRNVLTAIRAIAMGVKGIKGRKTLLLFSEGFVVGPTIEQEMQTTVSLANRSQVAIYCIDAKGLETKELSGSLVQHDELTSTVSVSSEEKKRAIGGETVFDRARKVGPDLQESPLRHVANETGGFFIRNTNDLSTGLDRIDQEMRTYYLISYRPKNEKLDGQFRQIRVGLKKAGMTVRARTGYYALPPEYELLTPDEYQVVQQVRGTEAAARIPTFLRVAGFQADAGQYRIPVILEIPTAAMRFEKKNDKASARLQIIGIVRDSEGRFATRFGGMVQIALTEAQYNVLKPGTMSFVNYVRLPAGAKYTFEVLVKDPMSGKVSESQQPLQLRTVEPTLALSTILLAKEVDQSPQTTDEFLTMQGVKILPSARCQFRNGDNLIFYFEVYNPKPDGAGQKTDVAIELSLLKDGKPLNARLPRYQATDYAAAPVPHLTFARFLHLAGLAAGNYTLVIDVKDSLGNKTARGQADFEMVN